MGEIKLRHEQLVEPQNDVFEIEVQQAMYSHLAQATDDIRLGKVQPLDVAFDEILLELDELLVCYQ